MGLRSTTGKGKMTDAQADEFLQQLNFLQTKFNALKLRAAKCIGGEPTKAQVTECEFALNQADKLFSHRYNTAQTNIISKALNPCKKQINLIVELLKDITKEFADKKIPAILLFFSIGIGLAVQQLTRKTEA